MGLVSRGERDGETRLHAFEGCLVLCPGLVPGKFISAVGSQRGKIRRGYEKRAREIECIFSFSLLGYDFKITTWV